jgi:hypothetical protein
MLYQILKPLHQSHKQNALLHKCTSGCGGAPPGDLEEAFFVVTVPNVNDAVASTCRKCALLRMVRDAVNRVHHLLAALPWPPVALWVWVGEGGHTIDDAAPSWGWATEAGKVTLAWHDAAYNCVCHAINATKCSEIQAAAKARHDMTISGPVAIKMSMSARNISLLSSNRTHAFDHRHAPSTHCTSRRAPSLSPESCTAQQRSHLERVLAGLHLWPQVYQLHGHPTLHAAQRIAAPIGVHRHAPGPPSAVGSCARGGKG